MVSLHITAAVVIRKALGELLPDAWLEARRHTVS
jgi:hypothetical protein